MNYQFTVVISNFCKAIRRLSNASVLLGFSLEARGKVFSQDLTEKKRVRLVRTAHYYALPQQIYFFHKSSNVCKMFLFVIFGRVSILLLELNLWRKTFISLLIKKILFLSTDCTFLNDGYISSLSKNCL